MIPSAHLRVYLPADRAGEWRPHRGPRSDRGIRISDSFVWDEPSADDALTTEWNGRRWLCPRYPRVRMLEGVLAFRNAYPWTGAILIPEDTVRRAASELRALRRADPVARSFILTTAWHVPLRWFAAFDPSSRELVERGGDLSIRYRTLVGEARRRLERALDVLAAAGFDESITEDVDALVEWLEEFSVDAMLELDYADVARLFSPGDLVLDESVSDIVASLEALDREDFDRAGDHYGAVATRWAEAQARTYTN